MTFIGAPLFPAHGSPPVLPSLHELTHGLSHFGHTCYAQRKIDVRLASGSGCVKRTFEIY